MTRNIIQTLNISFWAITEDIANEAFDYVYDKWFKHDTDDLEFDKFTENSSEGIVAHWKVTARRTCAFTPATREEPEDTDYSNLIDTDEPEDWIKIFMRENNLDENSIDEIYVDEDLEDDYDD